MLTTYASCWGSLALRGAALALMGAMLLALPGRPAALAMLTLVLIATAVNAASTGLRMRAAISTWWVPMLQAVVCMLAAVALLIGRVEDAGVWLAPLVTLAVLDGALLAWMAWQHRHGVHPVGAVAAAAAAAIGFGALLVACRPMVSGDAGTTAGPGMLALALGISLGVIALRLRRLVRRMRHELLRDAPLARQATPPDEARADNAGAAITHPARAARRAAKVSDRAGRVPA